MSHPRAVPPENKEQKNQDTRQATLTHFFNQWRSATRIARMQQLYQQEQRPPELK